MNILIGILFLIFKIHHWTMADNQVYQPDKQEIERFQVIQEQIRHHQQEEQRERDRKKKLAQEEMERRRHEMNQIQARHQAESILIPHSALVPVFVHKQQQHSDHRVPMPPLIPAAPASLQPPATVFGPFVSPHQFQNPHLQQPVPQTFSPPQYLHEMSINNPYNADMRMSAKMVSQMNPNIPGQYEPKKMHNKYHKNHYNDRDDREEDSEKFRHGESESIETSSRFDKNRHNQHHNHHHHGTDTPAISPPFRCYSCQWDIAKCSDFNCYNNPDICTTNNFAPHLVQQADCPGGCEEFVITDPNGLTQQWKRGCAQPASFPIVRMRCNTYYEFGVRIDRCVCNSDWCNGIGNSCPLKWVLFFTLIGLIITHWPKYG